MWDAFAVIVDGDDEGGVMRGGRQGDDGIGVGVVFEGVGQEVKDDLFSAYKVCMQDVWVNVVDDSGIGVENIGCVHAKTVLKEVR